MTNVTRLLTSVFAVAAVAGFGDAASADTKTTLVVSIRGLDNPYHANYKVGAEALGKALALPVDTLSTEANSQKGISDIKAEVAALLNFKAATAG